MSLEEEHEALHRRGEMIKFLLLVVLLVGTVLLLALLRPFVFERVVPAVLGLDQNQAMLPTPDTPLPTAPAVDAESDAPVIMTATPPAAGEEAGGNVESNGGAPLPTPQQYEVQAGDTLVEIAEQFGVSVQALVQTNAIANPNRIQPGDLLTIPAP